LRYRVGVRPLADLRRTADVVFPREHVAVFIDGCFWHGCPDHYRPSSTNVKYWADKVEKNARRDAETNALLSAAGWTVVRGWEHENPIDVAERAREAVMAARQ
jgi:DNA mismatch endonuclease (patch repair protein)